MTRSLAPPPAAAAATCAPRPAAMVPYRQAKEASVSNLRGGSLPQVAGISLVPWAGALLAAAIDAQAPALPPLLGWLLHWTAAVLPALLAVTVYAPPREAAALACSLLGSALLLLHRARTRARIPPPAPPSGSRSGSRSGVSSSAPALRFVTVYRAHMMLMTVLCILAVDFPVFPRALAKAENFGLSLMDLGVGSFVFSWGLVAARPLLSSKQVLNQSTGQTRPTKPYQRLWSRTWSKTWPLALLALTRVVAVKGVEYPEHMGEYGVHWNFFATLALFPLLGTVLALLRPASSVLLCTAAAALAVHEGILSYTWVASWALDPALDRVSQGMSVFAQNKEGFVSFTGYLVLFLLGAHVGLAAFEPSHHLRIRRLGLLSVAYSLVLFVVLTSEPAPYAAAEFTATLRTGAVWNSGYGVSRRLANVGYVIFTAAYNTVILALYASTQWALSCLTPVPNEHLAAATTTTFPAADRGSASPTAPTDLSSSTQARSPSPPRAPQATTPDLLASINRHAMPAFLLVRILSLPPITSGIFLLLPPTSLGCLY